MGKQSRKPKRSAMPYLAFAVICEKVLVESDGAHSMIRVVDTVTLTESTPAQVGSMTGVPLFVAVGFKSGDFRGDLEFRLDLLTPSSKRHQTVSHTVNFAPPSVGGANLRIPVVLKWEGVGPYWFAVMLGGREYTRVPLRVKVATEPASEEKQKPSRGKAK